MSNTVRISTQRLRQIIAIYFVKFVLSSAIASLAFILLAAINPKEIFSLKVPTYSNAWMVVACVLFFGTPPVMYVSNALSAKFRGVVETRINTEALKQTLFISLGAFWAAIGTLTLLYLTNDSLNALRDVAIVTASVSWFGVCRILLMYVQS